MKILFLHGLHAEPGFIVPTFLRAHGHEVVEPVLPPYRFEESVRIAQEAIEQQQPDAIVGYSRGGAVAMNCQSGEIPMVLLAPAWNWQGTAATVKPGTIILHSEHDDVVPLEHSRQLARKSKLPAANLVLVGEDHGMCDEEVLWALLKAIENGGTVHGLER